MDPAQALDYLIAELPGFKDYLAFPDESDPHLHPAMGDLGRYYMTQFRRHQWLAHTYWAAVERLATNGDETVRNAVHASLIEWFAYGDECEKAALAEATSAHGP